MIILSQGRQRHDMNSSWSVCWLNSFHCAEILLLLCSSKYYCQMDALNLFVFFLSCFLFLAPLFTSSSPVPLIFDAESTLTFKILQYQQSSLNTLQENIRVWISRMYVLFLFTCWNILYILKLLMKWHGNLWVESCDKIHPCSHICITRSFNL